MGFNVYKNVNSIFHPDDEEEIQKAEYQEKVSKMYGNKFNPYLKSDGSLLNEYIDYQNVLDNPNVNEKAKKYITQATGLTPTQTYNEQVTEEDVSESEADSTEGYTGTNWAVNSSEGVFKNNQLMNIIKKVCSELALLHTLLP